MKISGDIKRIVYCLVILLVLIFLFTSSYYKDNTQTFNNKEIKIYSE